MARGRANSLLSYLHHLVEAPGQGQPTDGELLQRFAAEGEEQAFQLLLQRHGPMVLAVCRRILHDSHEAEDSFQAAFVVLARKARSIRRRQSLAGWLYRVAYHIAVNARARLVKQRAREQKVAQMSPAETPAVHLTPEINQLLDEELQQLPDKYRMPLVLCYLEGKTHQQVAQELSWPSGTMSRRLARAQELLRRRLLRRGLVLSAAALSQALAANVSTAALPASLMQSTTQAAVLALWGGGAAVAMSTARVASLAEEALRGMAVARFRTVALALLAVGLVSVGAVICWPRAVSSDHSAADGAAAQAVKAPDVLPPVRDWGEPVHGVRLRCSCDRAAYRVDKDLIRVSFALHNVSTTAQSVLFLREGQEFTDVRITDADGQEFFVPGSAVQQPGPARWGGYIRHDTIHRVSMIIDPTGIAGGLSPGRYRLRGLFRRQPDQDSSLTVADLRLESNETGFTLLPAGGPDAETGPVAGGCALGLTADRAVWRPGEPPLSFAVVLHRRTDDLRALRFLEANQLGMYYHLEITDPDGHILRSLQPPESAGVDPRVDRFAHTRLMYLQMERIPVGRRLGECIAWDPSGVGDRHHRLEAMVRTVSMRSGRYTVRAVYQIGERDQHRYGSHSEVIRLVSNPVELEIGR